MGESLSTLSQDEGCLHSRSPRSHTGPRLRGHRRGVGAAGQRSQGCGCQEEEGRKKSKGRQGQEEVRWKKEEGKEEWKKRNEERRRKTVHRLPDGRGRQDQGVQEGRQPS